MRRIPSLVVAALLALGPACASATEGDPAAPASTAPAGGPTTTLAAAEADPEAGPDAAPDAYAVGRRSLELVDPTRPSAADPARGLPEEPQRTIPVLVLYPAAGPAPDEVAVVEGAPPAEGPFPLVVFSHGVTATGPLYEGRLQHWARAGYVVAAPTYPRSSGPGGQIADYVNQPDDVRFVLDELLALDPADPLAGHIDGEAVAAAGHSLGAITTLGVALHPCCADERIDAAVEISGIRLPFPGGGFDDLGRVPLLAVHGGADQVVPVAGSDSLFEEAPGPAHYLRLPDGDHSGFLVTQGALVDTVVVAFLDRYLGGDDDALAAAEAAAEASGVATFASK